jgi:hypothetical protein
VIALALLVSILYHGEAPTYIVIALALSQKSIFPKSESAKIIPTGELFEGMIGGQREAALTDE